VLAIDPDHFMALWFLGEAFERSVALSGRISRLLGFLGYAYGRAGRDEDARRMLDELEARETERYLPPYFPALVHCGLGETERALDRLERSREVRDTMIRDLRADPHWDRIRSEPRFDALLRKMAFPQHDS
jgi:hypothetical protein